MKIKKISSIIILFLTIGVFSSIPALAFTSYSPTLTSGNLSITLDGQIDDWSEVSKVDLTLSPAIIGESNGTIPASLKLNIILRILPS